MMDLSVTPLRNIFPKVNYFVLMKVFMNAAMGQAQTSNPNKRFSREPPVEVTGPPYMDLPPVKSAKPPSRIQNTPTIRSRYRPTTLKIFIG